MAAQYKLQSQSRSIEKVSQESIPKIDKMAGIECYCCSDFIGIGGSIKQGSASFKVTELIDNSVLDISKEFSGPYRYPLYLLQKEGIDSNHAIFEIGQEHHIRLRVMGIKDAKAVTIQYAGTDRTWQNAPKALNTRHTSLTLCGFTKRPLSKELLLGNEFSIVIQNPTRKDISGFAPQVQKIANFYGLQRFGSERLVTHLVGREIVRKNFANAVELLISYTTEYDTPYSRELRSRCQDPSNYRQVMKEMPKGMDIERQLISQLVAGKGPIAALRAIPIQIRRLFVQAYQAYIFNRCLSKLIAQGEDVTTPKHGDLCFWMEGPFVFGKIKKFESFTAAATTSTTATAEAASPPTEMRMIPAVRMVGYTFQPGKGRFEAATKELLLQDRIAAKDFYIKEMQELSQQGGFRQAPLCCKDFTWKQKNSPEVSFKLPKGSYATTLLRELIKPADPIKSGF